MLLPSFSLSPPLFSLSISVSYPGRSIDGHTIPLLELGTT